MTPADKVMFEIYRSAKASERFRVVYYTELDEAQRDEAIADACAGEAVVDGFLRGGSMPEARALVADVLHRLNGGEVLSASEILRLLAPCLASSH